MRRPFRRTDAKSRLEDYVTVEALRQITHGQHGDYKALSPRYRAWKAGRYPSRPLLVARGDTVRTITESSNAQFISKVTGGGKTSEIGSNSKIAAYHQKGTPRMPARPLFRITRRVAERMAEIVSDALTKGL
jgi:hypothetical protein